MMFPGLFVKGPDSVSYTWDLWSTAWSSNGDIWDSSYFHALSSSVIRKSLQDLFYWLFDGQAPKKWHEKLYSIPGFSQIYSFSILGKIIDLFIMDKLHIGCQKFTIDDEARDEWKC